MEKRNSVDNGVEGLSVVIKKLPVGFRFQPTDEEIVVHYLRKKASLSSITYSIIPEVDVFGTDPWNLQGDRNEKRYFFSRKIVSRGCKRIKTDSGYWKTICKTKRICAILGSIKVAGVRRTLIFCNHCPDSHDNLVVSRWMLHEISLTGKEDWGLGGLPVVPEDAEVFIKEGRSASYDSHFVSMLEFDHRDLLSR